MGVFVRAPTLGPQLALEVIADYAGEGQHIDLLPLDGTPEPGLGLLIVPRAVGMDALRSGR